MNAKGEAGTHLDIEKLSFEKALSELEAIVGKLERGDVELEQSIAMYERGEALKAHCNRLLAQAEAKVEKITTDASGRPIGTEPLDS
ncbi:MAG: exodeoxyribonuclease VII small subunit [Alphaproteobacteria bacterium]|nr:exodeoxyribonuclease VII small subunit [Alphaproteobacteria bacterium]